jgi:ferredoxin-type protein NapG
MSDQDWLDAPLDRHGFLEFVGKATLVIAIGGFLHIWGRKDNFVRPPRARPEDVFLSLCLRCDKCRKACPWDLITPVPLTESLINAGTPELHGYCRNCYLCVDACPTGALR